jgi:hypothetical protein
MYFSSLDGPQNQSISEHFYHNSEFHGENSLNEIVYVVAYLQDINGTLSVRENICNIFVPSFSLHAAAIYNFLLQKRIFIGKPEGKVHYEYPDVSEE